MAKPYTDYRTLGFQPAPPGWRTVWLDDQGIHIYPMPGWITQTEAEYDGFSHEYLRDTDYRNTVATRVEDYGVEPIRVSDGHFWFVLGPDEPEPTKEEAAAERARRKAAGPEKVAPHPIRPTYCPACSLPSTYVQSLDRYMHDDGSDNRPCWLTVSRGHANP